MTRQVERDGEREVERPLGAVRDCGGVDGRGTASADGVNAGEASCAHERELSFRHVLNTRLVVRCRLCGAPLRFVSPWGVVQRVLYFLMVGGLIYMVMGQRTVQREQLVYNILWIFGIFFAYLLMNYLLLRFAPMDFDAERSAGEAQERDDLSAEREEKRQAEEAETAEQAELRALYQHYADLNAEHGETADTRALEGSEAGTAGDLSSASRIPLPGAAADAAASGAGPCEHEIKLDWRARLPGAMDFTCAKCGAPVSFPARIKKSLNMGFLVVVLLMMYPMLDQSIPFWVYLAICAGVLLLLTVLQQYLIRKIKVVNKGE